MLTKNISISPDRPEKQLPPNDSAISLGQAWIAAQRYESIGA